MDIEFLPSLGLGSAERIVDRALRAAADAKVAVCVAVVDRAGYPLVFKRMSGAPLHSIDIAQDKAYTAVSFGRSTAGWERRLEKGSTQLRHGLMLRERFVGFGGGIPIVHEGKVVGGIGISGGTEAQDVAFAEAALSE
jgi:uncharacterized protein GlcG (DUF336 family)